MERREFLIGLTGVILTTTAKISAGESTTYKLWDSLSERAEIEKLAQLEREKYLNGPATHLPGYSNILEGYQIHRIVIDPGHGGHDLGASGTSEIYEKDLNLSIAQKLQKQFSKAKGVEVFLTRETDYYLTLTERTTIANQFESDLFISLHINASSRPDPKGCETYYCSESASDAEAARVAEFENSVLTENEIAGDPNFFDPDKQLDRLAIKYNWVTSSKIAAKTQNGLVSNIFGSKNRGVKFANFAVLRTAKMPAILIECGFISNPDEINNLIKPEYQTKIAEGIYNGVQEIAGWI